MSSFETTPEQEAVSTATVTEEVFRCQASFAQEQLWFLDQFEPDSSVYNLFMMVRIHGELSLPAFQQSLDALVSRHETLRTAIIVEDDHPIQIIYPELHFPIIQQDYSMMSHDEREAALMEYAQRETQRPFVLAHAPLWRVNVITLAPQEYAFIFTIHHIIFDGWSNGVFFRDLDTFYGHFAEGKTLDLPALTIQYADFAAWQREYLQGTMLADEVAFWKDHLKGVPALLDLPTDRVRPAQQTFNGSRYRFTVDAALTAEINQLSRKKNVTLFMTLLAAFQTLLSRYSGQQDFVIGTPIAGRTRVELEQIVGCFANTLALRADLSGDLTFVDLLHRVRDTALNVYAHQDFPIEKLVEELQPERNMSYNPVFQVMFSLQNNERHENRMANLPTEEILVPRVTSKFDLTCFVWPIEDHLLCSFEYNNDLFDEETIARMGRHFTVLLQQIVAQPNQPVAQLSLIDATERETLLRTWNATTHEVSLDDYVHKQIATLANERPQQIALICDGQTMTYGVLNARANQLACHLQRLGVNVDQTVGVCMQRSFDMVVALLGILKAGGAYVPLDPDYPAKRLAYMAEDAKCVALLQHAATGGVIPTFSGQRVDMDTDWPTIAREETTDVVVALQPEHLAYIIYTSGSTGVPKGVQIPHRALCNFLAAMRHEPGIRPDDVAIAVTSISFDIAGLELYLPLTQGNPLVLATRQETQDARALVQIIAVNNVTFMQATPATWYMLINAGWQGDLHMTALCGGEALHRDLAEALLARAGNVWNMYGPTETTIWSTISRVTTTDRAISIGRPIANTQIYLLDERRQLVPIGGRGELYIGGLGLARGYRDRNDLTAERFIGDLFGNQPGGRLYRTGDAARYRADGTIEYLGRLDSQVKVRGYRIELEEIESVLGQHPDVAQTVVIVREDVPSDQRIVAYFIAREFAPEPAELRAHMQQQLPPYMIPSAFVALPKFPLTPNGKVDRRAFPAPDGGYGERMPYIAPQTDHESQLVQIWESLLGTEPIGRHDNFFELGGHSLLATQLIARIRDKFAVELPLRVLFETPTIAALAVAIEQETGAPKPQITLIPRSVRRS